ncbi:MAG: response regulator [Candidatus Eremiobacteraeota bacterium]|nr:response regulator [Candidatus Eremiobacteraeota bacterium]
MKTILFINDNKNIRREATDILLEDGYASIFADNCSQGAQMLNEHIDGVVMVILDINLLVEHGIEIYDEIKAINPNLPVVTTSTAGHYRPRLGSDKKLVKYSEGDVNFDQ